MKKIGLHLRQLTTVVDIIHQAFRLKIPFFQCFLSQPKLKSNSVFESLKKEQLKQCNLLMHEYGLKGYVHASYAINLASGVSDASEFYLKKELYLARQAGFSEIILHPGSATGCQERVQGIDNVVRRLNLLLKKEHTIKVVLENAAFGAHTIGGDLLDFQMIRQKLDHPEKVGFCIDTAHAFVYGYNIADPDEQQKFIALIEQTIGFDALSLIHLNDTSECLSSKRDRHDIIGEGNIGARALQSFINHATIKSVPIVLELPVLPEEEQKAILHTINSW